jgi:hypothetical protein
MERPIATQTGRPEEHAMSGPIVRKYGFPNFEKIFGKKELEHGVDDADAPPPAPDAPPAGQTPEASRPLDGPRPTEEK